MQREKGHSEMKKVYITGLAGLLGSNLAFLLKDSYEVYGADIVDVKMPGIHTAHYDILEEDKVREELVVTQPDIVIHTVAAVNVDLCEANPEFATRLNASSTQILTNICRELGIKLIYISTDAVFDPSENRLNTEKDQTNPKNEYGRTKLLGEQFALKVKENLVLRTNIYGCNIQNKLSFGEWIRTSLLEDQTLNMFSDIYFSPILVNDLAVLIDLCIKKKLCGLYHACGTGSVNKYEFGTYLKKEFQIETGTINKSASDNVTFQAPRSQYMGMSNEKIKQALNVSIRTPYESIQYFRQLFEQSYDQKLKEFGGMV